MPDENYIIRGRTADDALRIFWETIHQLATIPNSDDWLMQKLERIRQLLTHPITFDEAGALLDVLYGRHQMEDLLEWLESREVSWRGFLDFRVFPRKQQPRKYERLLRNRELERRRAFTITLHSGEPHSPDCSLVDATRQGASVFVYCPDCGSADWTPIAYGFPGDEMRESVRLCEILLGGCTMGYTSRHCNNCLNSWPTEPDYELRRSREAIQEAVLSSRKEYERLTALADAPETPNEARVECAWARSDGTTEFLIAHENNRFRLAKRFGLARESGAPTYDLIGWYPKSAANHELAQTQAAVAAIRFERTNEPLTQSTQRVG